MSVFHQLLRIRDFREQRAQAAVIAELVALQRAVQARDAASDQLEAFKAYAQRRESDLFDDLQARAVQVRDIQEVRHEVGEMRAKERGYAETLDKAEAQHMRQTEALESARSLHEQAQRAKQKIEEQVIKDRQDLAWTREKAEETEREDVMVKNPVESEAQSEGEARHD